MKIDDNLEILNNELPEVFEGSKLPELWEEWIFLPNDKEDDIHPIFQSPDVNESFSPYDDTQISLENWYNYSGRLIVFPSDSKGKDGPVSEWDANCLPPVDALGFYLPYHYYYPVWWGIYLLADGVESLSNFLMTCANGGISKNDAVKAAKLFIYYHEYYHHLVESFATKLEVILREPIFKTGFKKTKKAYKALDRCKDGLVSEESLASAYSFRKTIRHFNDNKKVQKLISNSLIRYIKDQPLCYREAIEYIGQKEFIAGQCEMIDDFYCVSTGIESQKIKDVMLWTNFPYALSLCVRVVVASIEQKSLQFDRAIERLHDNRIFTGV